MANQVSKSLTPKIPQSKTDATLPWMAASLAAITIDISVVKRTGPGALVKEYIGLGFIFLVLLMLPEQIAAVFAPLVFIGILVAHHEFLKGIAKA
jgi:hypothetical protein